MNASHADSGAGGGAPRRPVVLVADDDSELRAIVADVIADEGYLVLEARDGDEALACVLQQAPDLMVLDHRMPGCTGAEVVTALRKASVTMPIIFMTASREVRELAASVGIDCYLGKPFSIESLIGLIKRALDGGC